MTVIVIFIQRKDKLYDKTIIDYWGIGYNVDNHHWIPILTSAITSVNISILWWISRHIKYLKVNNCIIFSFLCWNLQIVTVNLDKHAKI